MRSIAVIARFVVLEALRGGFPWLVLAGVGASVGLATFLAQVALTETRELQVAVCAALLRACAAFLIATHVVTSMAREASERALEVALTLPIWRSTYYAGKLAGFACCGALLATAFTLSLVAWSDPASLLLWWISLVMETALVVAMGLFFSTALRNVVSALAATAGLYLLGRSVSTIQAIVAGPLTDGRDTSLQSTVEALALLVPRFDWGTRTEWLVYGSPAGTELFAIAVGSAAYFLLLAAAGLFDFSRRDW